MINKLLTIALLLILMTSTDVRADNAIIVVANTPDKSLHLTRQEIRNLFMGGALNYALTAIALPPQNQTRILFNTKIIGLTESRIQSYWAQMRFSGRKRPPKELKNEQMIIEYLKHHEGTVSYLPATAKIPPELITLFEIN